MRFELLEAEVCDDLGHSGNWRNCRVRDVTAAQRLAHQRQTVPAVVRTDVPASQIADRLQLAADLPRVGQRSKKSHDLLAVDKHVAGTMVGLPRYSKVSCQLVLE